ncbi:MAG TPA: hypothetical protein VKU41_21110 [Polyangiaceae bacterium]|nr:hypothetical protein [Polyangiaceae bacterium]
MIRRTVRGLAVVAVAAGPSVMSGCLMRPIAQGNPTTLETVSLPIRTESVDKLDLLFMIDNSASMGDKQTLLAQAVPDMINRLVSPNCVDDAGNLTDAVYSAMTGCVIGKPEFPPVHDLHIGVVTSSLGARGGDRCDATVDTPVPPGKLNAHNDDRGELVNRSGDGEVPLTDAQSMSGGGGNFLAWFPPIQVNMGQGKTPPDVTALGPNAGSANAPNTLIGDFTALVAGVHEHGCGFEAQNEAWYRFLVQPDPFDSIQIKGQSAQLSGIDSVILRERADFLRPDSLVAVIVVTDENEEVASPLALGGQGWVFENSTFPGSATMAAPEGTIECKEPVDPAHPTTTGPYGPNCTTCAFVKNDPNFKTRCPDVGAGKQGYLDPSDDALNVRFWNQKQRFGVFVGYPTSRYVRGLTSLSVPDSAHETDKTGNYVGDAQPNCVNPLFATNLPTDPTADLCALQRGPRTRDLVYYAAIAGVPHQLLQAKPGVADDKGVVACSPGTAAGECPQKDALSDPDWKLILGNDPEHYDFTGADFHMIESTQPRTPGNLPPGVVNASHCPPGSSADTCDPINGREWDTKKEDLQFACVFDLPAPKECTDPKFTAACDCGSESFNTQTQLCQQSGGQYTTKQIRGKAYPSVREMIIAHAMGTQGLVSSLCPIHVQPANGDNPRDPLYGYRPAINTIINRLKVSLGPQCLPQKLPQQGDGTVPCLILLTLPGPGSCKNPSCDASHGFSAPSQDILNRFCDAQEKAWMAGGGTNSPDPDPAGQSVCALDQLTTDATPGAFDGAGSCEDPPDGKSLGWCYVQGGAMQQCPQAILFTNGARPNGSIVHLQCIEQAVTVVEDGGAP